MDMSALMFHVINKPLAVSEEKDRHLLYGQNYIFWVAVLSFSNSLSQTEGTAFEGPVVISLIPVLSRTYNPLMLPAL